jgi:ABC-2 type transport system permease protein
MSRYWIVMRMAFLRLLRNPTTMLVGLGVPLVLIPVLGYSFSGIPGIDVFVKGASVMTFMAMTVIIMFQLFSGSFMMAYVNDAYLTFRKWRMRMLPCQPSVVIFGILAAGLTVSLVQGAALAGLCTLILGARFGNFGVALLVFLGLSLFAQLLGTLMLLGFRSYGPAFAMTWIVAYGSCALGGMIFPLPTHLPVFRFLTTHGTPASLAQSALLAAARGGSSSDIALCLGVLFLASAILGLLISLLARRRLA